MSGKKVIFLDVDGTITDRYGNIPESAITAIRQARENGHLCVVNTGRPYRHLTKDLTEIGFDAYICACGQTIVENGAYLKYIKCSHELSETVIVMADKFNMDLFMEGDKGLWPHFNHEMRPGVRREFERFRKRGFNIDEDIYDESFSFDKFCTWEYEDSKAEEFRFAVSEWFTGIDRGSGLFEMIHNGCSKAGGIKEFMEMKGLLYENSYAAGDSTNDVTMLEAVAHPIVMGNADEGLAKYAEYVTESSEKDGIYKAFRYFDLI